MPTMLELAGLPAFDHTRTGEPPLGERRLRRRALHPPAIACAFDHPRHPNNRPVLTVWTTEGRSLAPLVLRGGAGHSRGGSARIPGAAGPRRGAGGDFGFNVSYSQYGRTRCPTDLFTTCAEADPESSAPAEHYIGYSVRTYTHRYTRWCNVTIEGVREQLMITARRTCAS